MSIPSIFLTKRGREKVAYEGYMYTSERFDLSRSLKFWRCDKRDAHHCKARPHTRVDTREVVKTVNAHSHDSNAAHIGVTAVCTAMKRRAEATMETPAVIINELSQGIPPSVSAQLPRTAAMNLMISRSRRAVRAPPPQPTSLASIIIPEDYKTYGDGEAFLLYDSGLGDEERILIFGRQPFGECSHHMKNIFADGTFRIAPPHFV
ncbi:hypothetical protein M514_05574 [Trichuris suis]|uniref:FLYWCH-type domain-containing protein n=1 Tax=Trichuris suis TaxID=68888 RepID=A0A085M8W2_9BILA|nr:hypothetical protein M513_05574 [Trichuris suis]KFD60093.1 hypothetical protein M514_05574 [Trichuris suis]